MEKEDLNASTKEPNMSAEETIEGQIRNAFPDCSVHFYKISEYVSLIYVDVTRKEGMILLLVAEQNTKIRRRPEEPDNVTWHMRNTPSIEEDSLLAMADGVVVCYGASFEEGEIWEQSTGNNRKGSYRRFAGTEGLVETHLGFDEIKTTFTESNLRAFFNGEALEDTCDYQPQRD